MLINNEFEVAQPLDKVWEFFEDVPQVAACLPGAELTEDLGDETYGGTGRRPDGPGQAAVRRQGQDRRARRRRQEDGHRRVRRRPEGPRPGGDDDDRPADRRPASGTKVNLDQDLQLSGAAAQYGRGMIPDVTSVLMGQFAANMQQRIDALERGESVDGVGTASASGLAIGLQATRMALMRVFRRFFLPYQPAQSSRSRHGAVVDRQHPAAARGRARAGRAAQPGARRARADPRRRRRHPGRRRRARRRAGRRTRGAGDDRPDRRTTSPPAPSATPAPSPSCSAE